MYTDAFSTPRTATNQLAPIMAQKAPFGRAVVIGGSIAGLTAARILTNHFDSVTVIERTGFPDGLDFPSGVPQARHPHILLLRGQQILEELFPGFGQDLIDGGADKLNFGRDIEMRSPHGWLPHYETDQAAIAASRRLLDHTVYHRLAENPKVIFKANSSVVSICTDDDNERVIGVQIHNRANGRVEDIPAELVVDASGRSSKAPEWFNQLGFQPPEEQTVNAFPGYATRIFEIPEAFTDDWKVMYIMPNPPHITRGAIILPMEGNRWHVSLIGMNNDHPPVDEKGFMEFARSLVSTKIYEALQIAKPISRIWGFRRAANRMRRYENLDTYLEGFVALGDAVYALNPVYGQGMTLATIASQLLDEKLAERAEDGRTKNFDGLAETFQGELAKALAIPWQTATNEDMRWPDTEGKQELNAGSKFIGGYFNMVIKTMPHSVKVTDTFYQVQHMVAPPTILMKPDILFTVLKTNLALRFSKS